MQEYDSGAFVKIAKDCWVAINNIEAIDLYDGRKIKARVQELERARKLHDVTRGRARRAVISLKSGGACVTNYMPETIVDRCVKSMKKYKESMEEQSEKEA